MPNLNPAGGSMSAAQWLLVILLGGVAGSVGQGLRMVVGLKKHSEEVASDGPASFDGARLLMSLFIAFTAGAVAAITTISDAVNVTPQQFVALAGAGYAGTDFIEGFVSHGSVPMTSTAKPASAAPTVSTASPPPAPSPAATDDYLG
jgi:hypothetical protein